MDRDQRTRLWARDTRGLRVAAGWVGGLAVVAAVMQASMIVWIQAKAGHPFWLALAGLGGPLWTLACGLLAMHAARVLATVAEIAWFSSPENPGERPSDPPDADRSGD